jgi:hypothetical protein
MRVYSHRLATSRAETNPKPADGRRSEARNSKPETETAAGSEDCAKQSQSARTIGGQVRHEDWRTSSSGTRRLPRPFGPRNDSFCFVPWCLCGYTYSAERTQSRVLQRLPRPVGPRNDSFRLVPWCFCGYNLFGETNPNSPKRSRRQGFGRR